jgi:hypothetical protein
MSNPNAKPPEGGDFMQGDDPRRNRGGRTPSKWLRDYLNAAYDKSPEGAPRRNAIAQRLFEIATGTATEADTRDSIEAAKLLLAYDMGKPTESVEMSNPDGTMSARHADEIAAIAIAMLEAKKASDDGNPSG